MHSSESRKRHAVSTFTTGVKSDQRVNSLHVDPLQPASHTHVPLPTQLPPLAQAVVQVELCISFTYSPPLPPLISPTSGILSHTTTLFPSTLNTTQTLSVSSKLSTAVALAAAVALVPRAAKLASPSYSGDGYERRPGARATVKEEVMEPEEEKPAYGDVVDEVENERSEVLPEAVAAVLVV